MYVHTLLDLTKLEQKYSLKFINILMSSVSKYCAYITDSCTQCCFCFSDKCVLVLFLLCEWVSLTTGANADYPLRPPIQETLSPAPTYFEADRTTVESSLELKWTFFLIILSTTLLRILCCTQKSREKYKRPPRRDTNTSNKEENTMVN